MQAKVTKSFFGAPDGSHYPRTILEGETITGDLALMAVDAGWASPLDEAPAESKALGAAPRNKQKPLQ